MSMSCFQCLGLPLGFPLILHVKPLAAHLSMCCFVWLLVPVSLYLQMCSLLSFSCSHHPHHVCQFQSERTGSAFSLSLSCCLFLACQTGWQTFTNNSTLSNADSACSDSSKSKVMSSLLPFATHKSFMSLSSLVVYSLCPALVSF